MQEGDMACGFAYMVTTPKRRTPFVLSGTFSPSKVHSKEYFYHINKRMEENKKPVFTKHSMVRVTLFLGEVVDENGS